MKKFMTVLQYELKEYFGNKLFMVLTAVLAALGAVLLFLPRFVDMSDFTGVEIVGSGGEEKSETEGEQEVFFYLDKAGVVQADILEQIFPEVIWKEAEEEAKLREAVETQEAAAGFVVTGAAEYEYYVFNKSMTDKNPALFEQAMKLFYRMDYCRQAGWNLEEITAMYDVPVTVTENVLNKDSGRNYWYCYFLVIVVFMLIVYYGQMIAVSVTNEKSNRAIEVLVTSTSPNSLLFGKVIAGAVGGVFQNGSRAGGRIAVLPDQQGTVGRYVGYVSAYSGGSDTGIFVFRTGRISVLCIPVRSHGCAGQQDGGREQERIRFDGGDYGSLFLFTAAADECGWKNHTDFVLPAGEFL